MGSNLLNGIESNKKSINQSLLKKLLITISVRSQVCNIATLVLLMHTCRNPSVAVLTH